SSNTRRRLACSPWFSGRLAGVELPPRCGPEALRCGPPAVRGPDAAGPEDFCAGAGAPGARFFTTSTCTVLLRPWLNDCRTLPASTVLPISRRPPGRRLSLLLPE